MTTIVASIKSFLGLDSQIDPPSCEPEVVEPIVRPAHKEEEPTLPQTETKKERASRMAKLISARAKAMYNKDTMKWTDCIRVAAQELKEDGKL